jgi:hypothetical protein
MRRRPVDISCLEALPCPRCGESLERGQGRQGLVWMCRNCFAGAVTLPILRRVAPRSFVNSVWQAAQHHGCDSRLACPGCSMPFTEILHDAFPHVRVCLRCYWVWLSADVLASFETARTPPALAAKPPALAAKPPALAAPEAAELPRRLRDG